MILFKNKIKRIDPEVEARIEVEHQQSEILVSWLQLGFIGVFLTVYYFAPKGFTGDQEFDAVLMIFSIYGPFVILRTALAHLRKLGPVMLTVSVLADVLVVGALIWYWHKQYAQPAPFYLKVPTFTAFYLMIALRALSFKVKYLVLAGASSSIVWMGLVYYALSLHPESRTNSFVDYITGSKVLIGAEVEKILSLLSITVILSITAIRSRWLLNKSVNETQANKSLSRFFSPRVIEKIRDSEGPMRPGFGELRSSAIMMMDLRGFTKMSTTMPPDKVMKLLAEYQARIIPIIFENGGSIDKFMGDGVLAHFGAAEDSTTYAADCMRASLALNADIVQWNRERIAEDKPPLKIGIGCAIGKVIFGAVGDQDRLELTTIGDAVNFAAKLEKHTKVLGVSSIVTETMSFEAIRQGFDSEQGFRRIENSPVDGTGVALNLLVLSESSLPTSEALAGTHVITGSNVG